MPNDKSEEREPSVGLGVGSEMPKSSDVHGGYGFDSIDIRVSTKLKSERSGQDK